MNLSLSSTLLSSTSSSKPLFVSQAPQAAVPANNRGRERQLPVLSVSCRATTFATNIGNGTTTTNLYKVLCLSPKKVVGPEEIKRAYRRQALRYHPDVCPASMKDESTRMFLQLNQAYQVLSDPVSKRAYDSQLGLSLMTISSFRPNDHNNSMRMDYNDQFARSVWQHQLSELKNRKSKCRMGKKDGSWGSRMRVQNKHSRD